jgi:hypothetical protein
MQITVPVGSEATVYVPLKKKRTITESGKKKDSLLKNVSFIKEEGDYQIYKVESGEYSFISE